MKKIFPVFLISFCLSLMQSDSIAQQNQSGKFASENRNAVKVQPNRQGEQYSISPVYPDTLKRIVREVAKEVPAYKNALIKIVNTVRNIEIRTWPEAKVRIVALVNVEEKKSATITEEELMETGGLGLKSFGNRVEIQSVNPPIPERISNRIKKIVVDGKENVLATNAQGMVIYNKLPDLYQSGVDESRWSEFATRKMTIYLPDSCRLDIDNRYTNILIVNDISEGRFKMSRSNLDARNFHKLNIAADLYNINISDVDEAELELESGSFTAGAIRLVDLDSKSSEIDYEGGEQLYLRSQSDRIIVDEIARVDGRKMYGDLRIGKLLKSIDIEGTNADIKIRTITADVESVKINDKYADLRLPVKSTPNFLVAFKGDNSTVFAPFEKQATTEVELTLEPVNTADLRAELTSTTATAKKATHGGLSQERFDELRLEVLRTPVEKKAKAINDIITRYDQLKIGKIGPAQFKGSGGDTTGKHTAFNITCNQCTVDFK
ncbi:MAG: hypothetical protein ABW007_21460 [Chitinophagaceae bacterium]